MTVVSGCTVSDFVAACQYEIGIQLALYINSRTGGIGDVSIVQVQFEIGLSVDSQRAVSGLSCHHVADALRTSVTSCHMITVDGDGHTFHNGVHRIGHINIYHLGKGVAGGGVTFFRISCSDAAGRLFRRLVKCNGKAAHLTIHTRTAASGGVGNAAAVIVVTTVVCPVVVVVAKRIVRRTCCCHHCHCSDEHEVHHFLFHCPSLIKFVVIEF